MSNKKDLSYDARSTRRLQGLIENIAIINSDLKYEGYDVSLSVRGKSLNIRHKDDKGIWKTRTHSEVKLSPTGIQTAKQLAVKIGQALQSNEYSQDWYDSHVTKVKPLVKIVTWYDAVNLFPDLWRKYRSGDKSSTDRQKEVSLKRYTVQLRLMGVGILPETHYDSNLIAQLLTLHPEGTDKKFRVKETLSIVSTIMGVPYDYGKQGKRPTPQRREPLTDAGVVAGYHKLTAMLDRPLVNKQGAVNGYRWIYGILATYGLRPQEVFAICPEKSFKPETDYWVYLDEVLTDGLKTGSRWVMPLYPEWVTLFNLPNITYPPMLSRSLERRVAAITGYFRKHELGTTPYSLRHAYAIRGRLAGQSLMDMADSMGHDPAMHTKTYQRWIGVNEKIESARRSRERQARNEI
jgi:integrase